MDSDPPYLYRDERHQLLAALKAVWFRLSESEVDSVSQCSHFTHSRSRIHGQQTSLHPSEYLQVRLLEVHAA